MCPRCVRRRYTNPFCHRSAYTLTPHPRRPSRTLPALSPDVSRLVARACGCACSLWCTQVFSYFDALSYDLSKMNLSHFRQNAMRNDMMNSA